MLSVNQSWNKLTKCILGKTYMPEFYSFINKSSIRNVFEKIAQETGEDLNQIQKKIKSFQVEVYRPEISNNFNQYKFGGKFFPPPLTPRDDIGIIGTTVFMPQLDALYYWRLLATLEWNVEPPRTTEEWNRLPNFIKDEFARHMNIHSIEDMYYRDFSSFKTIEQLVKSLGNKIIYDQKIDTAMICRVGKDLYSGLWPGQNKEELQNKLFNFFPDYKCHIIDTQGHLDGVFTVLGEGVLLANEDLPDSIYNKHFPNWEIIRVKNKNSDLFLNYQNLKRKNQGKWLVTGQENNYEFTDFVELYINNWLGFAEETSIGVNVLMIDEHNMLCVQEDAAIFKRLEAYGITAHVVPFRHYNFWDSGVHCLTVDLERTGNCIDFFPEHSKSLNHKYLITE